MCQWSSMLKLPLQVGYMGGRGGLALLTSPKTPDFPLSEPLVLLTVCRPWSVTFHRLMQNNPNQSYDTSVGRQSQSPAHWELGRSGGVGSGPSCLLNYPVMREDTDVVSVHFQPLNGAFVMVHANLPSVMQLRLDTGMDSGGSLIIRLRANQVSSGSPPKQSTVACDLGLFILGYRVTSALILGWGGLSGPSVMPTAWARRGSIGVVTIILSVQIGRGIARTRDS